MKTFCIKCGDQHPQEEYPKKCSSCNHEMYLNPIPVIVVSIPVLEGGRVVIQRGIPPHVSGWALPGGFMEQGETIEEAGTREVFEETGLRVENLKLSHARSNDSRTNLLLFMTCDPVKKSTVVRATWFLKMKNAVDRKKGKVVETLDMKVSSDEKLCFPTHQEFFDLTLKK